MAKDNIEDFSTEKLIKRKRFVSVLLGSFIGIILVWIGLILWELIGEGKVELRTFYGIVPPLAFIWFPILMLKNVNKELERRNVD